MSRAARLKEYGMYIRRTKDGKYNLGWTDAAAMALPPGGLATFDTYDDAYEAFEEAVEYFWGAYQESLMRDVGHSVSACAERQSAQRRRLKLQALAESTFAR